LNSISQVTFNTLIIENEYISTIGNSPKKKKTLDFSTETQKIKHPEKTKTLSSQNITQEIPVK
jgi:hypothetical protein